MELSIKKTDGTTQYCNIQHLFTDTAETLKEKITGIFKINNKDIQEVTTKNVGLYIQGLGSGTAIIGRPKIEIGNKATDWTPAPEDATNYTDTQITTAKSEIKQKKHYCYDRK